MKIKTTAITLALLMAFVFTIPAFAGGWASVTLDEFPTNIVASESFEIGFTILQHGVTPVTGMTPIISGELTGTKESFSVYAKEEGNPGHYTATIMLPKSGEWSWKIKSFGEQSMPPLTVTDAPQVVETVINQSLSSWLAGGVATGFLIIGLFMMKSKTGWAVALVLVGLIVGGVGFVSAAGQAEVKVEAQESVSLDSKSQVDYGRDLFVAKGCLACHYHEEVASYMEIRIDAGPNLTNFSAAPEYLRMRLKDPKSVKSDSKMPQLQLSETEIEALIAFVNSD